MFTRYWGVSIAGLGLGFGLGVVSFVLMVAAGLQAYLTVAGAMQTALSYGLAGVVVAAAACVGGWLWVASNNLRGQPATRASAAAAGAATGTVLLGVAVGVLGARSSGPGFYPFITALIVVLAGVSAIAAAVLVSQADKPRRAGRAKADRSARESPWTTF